MIALTSVNTIRNVAGTSYNWFGDVLRQGLLAYYDIGDVFHVLNAKSLHPMVCSRSIEPGSVDYFAAEGWLALQYRNKIVQVDIDQCEIINTCSTDKDRIFYAGSGYCRASTTLRNPKRRFRDLLELQSETVVYSWEGDTDLYVTDGDVFIFCDNRCKSLTKVNLNSNTVDWRFDLDEGISGIRFSQLVADGRLVLPRKVDESTLELLSLDLASGQTSWSMPDSLSHYQYSDVDNVLHGLAGGRFESINASTGQVTLRTEVEVHTSPHLTCLSDGVLYFSGFRDENVPIIGGVDVSTGALLFTQEVRVDGESSFRRGLDAPVVVADRIYVRDAGNVLHVYERARQAH